MNQIGRAIKALLRPFIPEVLRAAKVKKVVEAQDAIFATLSPKEAFSLIYEQKMWGGDEGSDFYSGTGSHNLDLTQSYVTAINDFLSTLKPKAQAVDLGCGDFNIGKQIRPFCDAYIACDVVPALIERNKKTFIDLEVQFVCIDITTDVLPIGNVVFIRQVLQHLSNAKIIDLLPKIKNFEYLVLTEHMPESKKFIANRDKPIGAGIRLGRGRESGVVITAAPFNLAVVTESIICEVPEAGGIIRTTLYRLK